MPWIPAAIAAVGGAISGGIQSSAQDRATKAQQQSAQNALEFQKNQWQTAQTQMQPYRQVGETALPQLQRVAGEAGNIDPTQDAGYKPLTGLESPGQFNFSTTGDMADPSYTWRLNQGLNAVNSSAAARGGYFSGNTGKALMDYGQGAASQEYGNQFGRYNQMMSNYMQQEGFNADLYNQAYNRQMGMNQNQYNQYSNMANMGQNAANATMGAGNQFATNAGNMAINQGNITGTGAANQADIWGNAISNASNQFMSAWGQDQQMDQINKYQFKPYNPDALGPGH
jgi:hypothetical protein